MSEERFESCAEAQVDALLRRTVPGEESTSPDEDLIFRVKSIASRRAWGDPGVLGVCIAAAVVLVATISIYMTDRSLTGPPITPPNSGRIPQGAVTRSTVPVALAAESFEVEREGVAMRIQRTPTGVAIVFGPEGE